MKIKVAIGLIVLLIASAVGYYFYQHYEGDFFEVCFTYFKDDATYVVVGEESIKIADEHVKLYAKHIINDPFNHKLQSPTEYKTPNAYMFETLVTLYDDEGMIYVVDVKEHDVFRFDHVETYQVNDDKDELLVQENGALIHYTGKDFESSHMIIQGIQSFIASDNFKDVFVVTNEGQLLHLNLKGEIEEIINSQIKSPTLLRMDDYLMFNDKDRGYVYAMDYDQLIAEFDQYLYFENCQYIDNTLLIRTGNVMYQVIGNDVDRIRGNYLLSEDVSSYYAATNKTVNQMRGDVQALLLDQNEEIYAYTPKGGRSKIDLGPNEKYIGSFTDEISYLFKEEDISRITYYSEKNGWQGRRIYLDVEPLWLKGHNAKNFIFVSDERSLLQFYNGETVIPLNILSKHFQTIYYGDDDDYYIVDQYGVVRVTKDGKDVRIFEDAGVTNTLFDPASGHLYFINSDKSLFEVKGDEVTLIEKSVKRLALFRKTLYYINGSDQLIHYKKGVVTVIDDHVSGVHSVAFNIRLLGSYNSVHMFYILEQK